MVLSFSEMEARDRRAELEPDGREEIPESQCPCGEVVTEVEVRKDMLGGRDNVRLRFYHNRVDYCEFLRRF